MKPSPRRAGNTEKVSVSLSRADLATVRRRARRRHGSNLSAAIAEGIHLIREQEGREALVAWLGDAAEMTPEQRDEIHAEWRGDATGKRRSRAG